MIDLSALQKDIHAIAKEKGFWDSPITVDTVPAKLMLVVSEVAEAMEADRKDKKADWDNYRGDESMNWELAYERYLKGSFGDELADIIIRVLDLSEYLGIDLSSHIEVKVEYNQTRPLKHGKKY